LGAAGGGGGWTSAGGAAGSTFACGGGGGGGGASFMHPTQAHPPRKNPNVTTNSKMPTYFFILPPCILE